MADNTLSATLCLLSGDACLVHLIVTEAHELGLPLTVVRTLSEALQQRAKTLIWDLDDALLRDAAAGVDGVWDMIGICRQPEELPEELRQRMCVLIERPFPTAKLREILSRWSGQGSLLPQNSETPAPQSAVFPMSMEDDATLLCGQERIRLTPKEAALMKCLLAHRGEIVSRQMMDECIRSIGKDETDSNKTEVYLCFLRRKIERPLGLRLITTVRGKGYRLE